MAFQTLAFLIASCLLLLGPLRTRKDIAATATKMTGAMTSRIDKNVGMDTTRMLSSMPFLSLTNKGDNDDDDNNNNNMVDTQGRTRTILQKRSLGGNSEPSSNSASPFYSLSSSSSNNDTDRGSKAVVTVTQKDLLVIFGLAMVVLAGIVVRLLYRIKQARGEGLLPSANAAVDGEQYELVGGTASSIFQQQQQQPDYDGDDDVIVS